jgi:ribosomal protein L37AE/L43A
MYKKTCTRCTRPSYSSTESGEWICPTCGFDLSTHAFYNPSNYQIINEKVLPLRRKLENYKNSMFS